MIAEPVAANLNDEILVSTSSYNEAAETTAEIISDVNRSLPHNVVGNTLMIEKETLKPQRRKEILSQSEMFKILLKLEKAMESEKYYRNSELTLDGLAKLTSINKYHISETLNHFVNKPFYTFINEYRIGYVKEQLKSLSEKSSSINILDLAYESGFNSKSSFNKYFKEITSHTPREYINLIAAELVV